VSNYIITRCRKHYTLTRNSISAAEDSPALRKADITHILSVTTRHVSYPERIKLEIKRIELEDDPDVVRILNRRTHHHCFVHAIATYTDRM
jgi:hypothetical protein